ncbi:5-formyltetrahydrofolate cyclo-ligase [Lentilactobacillus parabuchneri]|nr:5-formyltetrahydrofolate cyclo-ligase [Lentilactobacillus parabuchneri]APR08422.1 putative 5-formyltetrahydrofolate cyclo-ligase [Lentilactobacillus parabuchneri]MBW0221991.1 5-formyltetrahydrofolate cyclo-ligase [Lentilactobacillus parabuchneri]MBW0244785.1 5-formyltetrahydrofolate cyclo-ligase [Lentilactobacillus parabuchneri]MBW0262863.1 5-formyltetrahydrofolate cyclo-ligase [Lentilactobacillus parabuchneri]MCT2885497.1 5-formyltetrahydrofolate cyclo-ligase [Lentilactobacillus parabuchne
MAEIVQSKRALRELQTTKLHDFLKDSTNKPKLAALYQRLFDSPAFNNSRTIGVTLSMDDELDTQPIIHEALAHDIQVAVPRTLPHRQMEFVLLEEKTQLNQTKFGTIEPVNGTVIAKNQMDVLIVPGLAFSRNHYRVGYGGGFYDRFLKGFEGVSISIATPVQLFEQPVWDVETFDVPIDQLIFSEDQEGL